MAKSNKLSWEHHYKTLLQFYQQHGHTLVPRNYGGNSTFGRWVETQRLFYKKKRLPEERIRKLNELNFVWEVREEAWNEHFKALQQYKKEHGHTKVPRNCVIEGKKLGRWVTLQRKFYSEKSLPKERMQKLEQLGFMWDCYKEEWEKNFKALSDFKEQFGHCSPQRIKRSGEYQYKNLVHWVQHQRHYYKKGKLDKGKIRRLEELGFAWSLKERVGWEGKYQMLVDYYNKHGHCSVPHGLKEYKSLRNWVNQQRVAYNKGNLSDSKINRLEELDFVWVTSNKS